MVLRWKGSEFCDDKIRRTKQMRTGTDKHCAEVGVGGTWKGSGKCLWCVFWFFASPYSALFGSKEAAGEKEAPGAPVYRKAAWSAGGRKGPAAGAAWVLDRLKEGTCVWGVRYYCWGRLQEAAGRLLPGHWEAHDEQRLLCPVPSQDSPCSSCCLTPSVQNEPPTRQGPTAQFGSHNCPPITCYHGNERNLGSWVYNN